MLRWWLDLAVSLLFGVAASIIPLLNNETYLLATQGFGLSRVIPTVVGLAVGNAIGKSVIVELLRAGRSLPFMKPRDDARGVDPQRRPRLAALQSWWRRWSRRLLDLMSKPGWAVPITIISAATGVPPFYAVTVVVGAGGMSRAAFFSAGLAGSVIRFAVLAAMMLGLIAAL